jgi:hypothetical protein
MAGAMKWLLRSGLLGLYDFNLATIVVALRRGLGAATTYLDEIHLAGKIKGGAYLPTITPQDFISDKLTFGVYRTPDWEMSMDLLTISSLACIVASLEPRKILEIGSYKGLTTLNLAINAPDAEIYAVDLEERETYWIDRYEAARIHQYQDDSSTFDFSVIGSGIDFCLIDGGHSYEQVKTDTQRVLPFLADNALLLWDDYGRCDFLPDYHYFGVSRFVHEIARFGVCVLYDTSIALLQLDKETRQALILFLES